MHVSIIIRTFNRAPIILEAISSALIQSYRHFDIIVVDDGSTDNTADLVHSLGDSRVRLVRHETNRGVAAACNTGISAATGELVAFLDSDDLWKVDKLERQVTFLLCHPDVDAVFSDTEVRTHNTTTPSLMKFMTVFPQMLTQHRGRSECIIAPRDMYLCLLQELPIKPTTLLVRRAVFSVVDGFDETCQSGEDWEFLLRLSRHSHFGYIDQPLAVHRWTSDAAHRRYWEQDKLFLLRVFHNERLRLRNDNEALQAVTRGMTTHYNNLGYHYLSSGQHREAMATYFKGFRDTARLGLLVRAAAVVLPSSLRGIAKSVAGHLRGLLFCSLVIAQYTHVALR